MPAYLYRADDGEEWVLPLAEGVDPAPEVRRPVHWRLHPGPNVEVLRRVFGIYLPRAFRYVGPVPETL